MSVTVRKKGKAPATKPAAREVHVVPEPSTNDMDRNTGVEVDEASFLTSRRSEITCAERCPRLSLLSYVYRIRRVQRPQAMDQSSYAHVTLALLLRGMDVEGVMSIIQKIMDDVLTDTGNPTDVDRAKDANMGFAVGCYAHDRLMDYIEAKNYTIRNIEEKFTSTLRVQVGDKTLEIPFRFQTDFVVENPKNGHMLITDLKAIGTSTRLYARSMQLYLQSTSYVIWASQPDILGEQVRGMLFLLVGKPSCNRKGLTKKDAQPLLDYMKEAQENLDGVGRWASLADKRANDPAIQIVPVIPTPLQKQMALKRMFDHHQRKLRGRNHINYPVHDSCVAGFTYCSHLDLCELDPTQWQTFLKTGNVFTTRPDPLDSERLHGANLKPLRKSRKVVIHRVCGKPDKVLRAQREPMTMKWRTTKGI